MKNNHSFYTNENCCLKKQHQFTAIAIYNCIIYIEQRTSSYEISYQILLLYTWMLIVNGWWEITFLTPIPSFLDHVSK